MILIGIQVILFVMLKLRARQWPLPAQLPPSSQLLPPACMAQCHL